MKILFLTYDLPYPLNSGGKIRAHYLIKGLAKHHQITLFSYYRDEDQKKYLPQLKKHCQKIYLFKRKKPWSWQNILRSFSTYLPFPAATYYSPQLEKALQKELENEKYDLVHFESFYPALYLPVVKKRGIKTVMGNENIEYQVYQRFTDSLGFFPFRWLLKLEVLKIRLFEERLWRLADVNLALSGEDAAVLEKAIRKDVPIIPNGVDLTAIKKVKKPRGGKNLLFIGTLIYPANSDAIKHFLKKIYPEIKRKFPDVKFILVSWHKPRWLEKYLTDSSIVLIQDKKTQVGKLLGAGDVFVAPIRVASGTNIKVLEAMAAGLPVVTTSVGIEGIKAKPDREVLVGDNPADFTSQVVELLKNKEKQQKLSKSGRLLVERLYNWAEISQKLEKVYQELANG